MEKINLTTNWIVRGLIWGSFMFLTLAIVIPLVEGAQLVVSAIILKLAVWLVMGLAYGYTVHLIKRKKRIN